MNFSSVIKDNLFDLRDRTIKYLLEQKSFKYWIRYDIKSQLMALSAKNTAAWQVLDKNNQISVGHNEGYADALSDIEDYLCKD